MGIFSAEIYPEMTQETKDRVKHEEIERVLRLLARELRDLKERVKVLEK